jgi:CheY-like chemotaxis protein
VGRRRGRDQIDRLLAAGAHEYVTKPFDVRRLLEVLERMVPDDVRDARRVDRGRTPAGR